MYTACGSFARWRGMTSCALRPSASVTGTTVPWIEPSGVVTVPAETPGYVPVYHLYIIRMDAELREELRVFLQERGIATGIHYPIALPNLKEKGKKRSFTRYTYDLTDRNRGFGQVLDKKATLRKVIESNIALGNLPDLTDIDPTRFLIAPRDKVYRILSREKDYESQAMVFFLRDYSGSMSGKVTELVATQHVLIYSWLIYQYSGQVESRFILHDTEAREVPDFHTYYNSQVAGGTEVAAAYKLVNEIVAKENLSRDYNIYVFHGTDGDDWDTGGEKALPELKTMLTYSSRVGVTIAEHGLGSSEGTEVARYLESSGLLKEKPELIRLDVMQEDADEPRLIEGIKRLIS